MFSLEVYSSVVGKHAGRQLNLSLIQETRQKAPL